MKERRNAFASYLTTSISFILSIGLFTATSYALGIQELWDIGEWNRLVQMHALLIPLASAFVAIIVGLITYFSNEM